MSQVLLGVLLADTALYWSHRLGHVFPLATNHRRHHERVHSRALHDAYTVRDTDIVAWTAVIILCFAWYVDILVGCAVGYTVALSWHHIHHWEGESLLLPVWWREHHALHHSVGGNYALLKPAWDSIAGTKTRVVRGRGSDNSLPVRQE